ncbi:MAG: succinate--CoA ligase subunit alpha [Firmicutes bacterium]|mgnify:CR=1 FL=1|jgi:succinyl-CoA synthetase alpha subunit|nr:succinate--CoA ligase subunit alpha [Bacillota bacterium]
MAIIIDEETPVLIQGITGNQGSFHTARMLEYGTRVVAGVTPGKGGRRVEGVPVYNTVASALREHEAGATILFTPAPYTLDAAMEALEAGIGIMVVITEHIPVHDAMEILACADRKGTMVVGPNTFGLVSAGKSKIGIMPNHIFTPGPVGIISRSGTLCYEVAARLKDDGLGTSTVVGLGGDRVVGLSFTDVLKEFASDPQTEVVVMIGEIGGSAEEEAAFFVRDHIAFPVISFIAGRTAPPGRRMGHAGAIIERGRGSYEGKVEALSSCGVKVARFFTEIPALVRKEMGLNGK